MNKYPKERNKPKKVKVSNNPVMNAYQKIRQDDGGTVIFNYTEEVYSRTLRKIQRVVVAKKVVKLDKATVEKRSISEFLGLLNSMQHDFGASSYTF